MATNFGFMPVLTGKRYFISYKNEDTARVGEITRRLNQMGVPMWYDYGIEKGERWSNEINRNIEECEAFILFATRKLFAAEDTWVRKEFRLASMSKKKKYVVWLDDLNPYENPNDVHSKLKAWFVDVDDLQGIRMAGKTVEHIAWSMVTEFHLIQGKKPQPPSPTFQPPVSKPEPKPVSVTQPINQPNPATYTAPHPQQSATAAKPVTAPVFKDSTPKQEQMKPVTQKSVKHTPLIVTVAAVLVIAMVSGIWAVSNSTGTPTNDSTFDTSSHSTGDSTSDTSSHSTGDSTSDTSSTSSEKTGSQIKSSDLAGLDAVYNGDYYTFTFGNYPQGANGEVQPIEWRVLTVENGKALVISEKLLDYVKYNEENTSTTWENCTLRKWMNNTFISEAFNTSERAKIVTVSNQNPDNPYYNSSGGNTTQDKIFALSIAEVEKYFLSDVVDYSSPDRIGNPTDYSKKHRDNGPLDDGVSITDNWWWLRSPGEKTNFVAVVDGAGFVNPSGFKVTDGHFAVRPAFWLNLK